MQNREESSSIIGHLEVWIVLFCSCIIKLYSFSIGLKNEENFEMLYFEYPVDSSLLMKSIIALFLQWWGADRARDGDVHPVHCQEVRGAHPGEALRRVPQEELVPWQCLHASYAGKLGASCKSSQVFNFLE